MSFGEWQAYAQQNDWGRSLDLNIGREVAPGVFETITEIGPHGAIVKQVTLDPEEAIPHPTLRIPFLLGEPLFKALQRVYGQENQDGQVKALQEALQKERERVDCVLDTLLRPTAVIQ